MDLSLCLCISSQLPKIKLNITNPQEPTFSVFLASSDKTPTLNSTSVFRSIFSMFCTESFSKTNTLHRLSSALLTWNDGFSVVAPINTIVPSSTWGRKASFPQTKDPICISDIHTQQFYVMPLILREVQQEI